MCSKTVKFNNSRHESNPNLGGSAQSIWRTRSGSRLFPARLRPRSVILYQNRVFHARIVLLQDVGVTNDDGVQQDFLFVCLFFVFCFLFLWFVQLLEMEDDERTEKRSLRITEHVNY